MRVVAGKYRHRLLTYPDSEFIRPTKDRIREALFSSLGDINGLVVLDLYAGSGAMGIEAISRGASKCVFVDNNALAVNTVKGNLSSLGILDYELLFLKDFEALAKLKLNNYKFDLVILDPPYKSESYIEIINYLINNDMLNSNSRIVTECNRELDFSSLNLKKKKEYRYGEITLNVLYL